MFVPHNSSRINYEPLDSSWDFGQISLLSFCLALLRLKEKRIAPLIATHSGDSCFAERGKKSPTDSNLYDSILFAPHNGHLS